MIVTEVRLYRDGLAQILAGQAVVEVVGTASPGRDVPALVEELNPHVVLVDSSTVRSTELVGQVI